MLKDVIEESKTLLQLKDDWDDDGALCCNSVSYYNAIEILTLYHTYIEKTYSIIIQDPEINLCKDGSIDIEWRDDKFSCLFNIINSTEFLMHYYAVIFNFKAYESIDTQGKLDSKTINNELVNLMKEMI